MLVLLYLPLPISRHLQIDHRRVNILMLVDIVLYSSCVMMGVALRVIDLGEVDKPNFYRGLGRNPCDDLHERQDEQGEEDDDDDCSGILVSKGFRDVRF